MAPGRDGRTKPKITCFRCEKKGNFADLCPDIEAGQQHVEVREQHHINTVIIEDEQESESDDKSVIITFHSKIHNNKAVKSGKLRKDSVLLNTFSTCSVFNCKKIIVKINKINKTLRAYINGGHQESKLEGELPDFSRHGTTQNQC